MTDNSKNVNYTVGQKCPQCSHILTASDIRNGTHICIRTVQQALEKDWEYEVVHRTESEILLIIFKRGENTRGYIRLNNKEELEQWIKTLDRSCSKKEF